VFAQNLPQNKAVEAGQLAQEQLFSIDQQDAIRFCKGRGAMWGAAASTALRFSYGLAGAAIIGLTPPRVQADTVSDVSCIPITCGVTKGRPKRRSEGKRRRARASVLLWQLQRSLLR